MQDIMWPTQRPTTLAEVQDALVHIQHALGALSDSEPDYCTLLQVICEDIGIHVEAALEQF